jgi:hypothetical protein
MTNQTEIQKVLANSCTMDEAIDKLAIEQKTVSDFLSPLKNWSSEVDNSGDFVLRNNEDGRDYKPTDHALDCMCRLLPSGMSTWAVKALRSPYTHPTKKNEHGEPVKVWDRDRRDGEVLKAYVDTHLFQSDRLDQEKTRLFRTWDDGTLRAVLSNQYARVNNRWYLQVLRELMPDDARVIRTKGNADTIYMDIFLGESTDTNDGGLGSMLHVGNSEIGERRVVLTPSILRFICTNGMIGWSRVGDEIRTVHRRKDGIINHDDLQKEIVEKYKLVAKTFETGIEKLLGLKAYGMGDNVSVPQVFTQMMIDNQFSKREVRGVWEEWGTEMRILGADEAKTAYGLQNAVTRYSQRLDGPGTYKFDRIGGAMADHNQTSWDKFLGRARNLTDKEITKRLGDLATAS